MCTCPWPEQQVPNLSTLPPSPAGGYWVNLGPLLYHFADQPGEASIEPSFEEVKAIAEGLGFELFVSSLTSVFGHFQHDRFPCFHCCCHYHQS